MKRNKKTNLNQNSDLLADFKYFDVLNDAVFIANPLSRKIIDCNMAALKLLGYSKKKILSMKADDFHPKNLQGETMKGFKNQARGLMETVISEVLTINKKRIPVSITTSVVNSNNKKYIIGIFTNITKIKETEKELEESEQKYKNLINNLPKTEYILVVQNDRLVWISNNVPRTLGFSRTNIINSLIFDYVAKEYKKIVADNAKRRLLGKKVGDYIIKIKNNNGKLIEVRVRGSLIDYYGKPACLLIL